MKANELKIGNWVNWNGENGVVSQILEHEVVFRCGEDALISELKPIELTEEILLKCGFLNWNGYYSKSDIKYEEENIVLNFWSDDSYIIKGIKHLHQLQNLYFALTGEELNIKL